MQSQPQNSASLSAAGIDHSLSPNWNQQSQEPYYSNEDIVVLHDVITTAQLQLDQATFPKPLPAAALFKAYDEILPQHGIDPDSDHHLSTLIFRVSGEQGDGTLLQKLQTMLGRMGIILQFGDDSTLSIPSGTAEPIAVNNGSKINYQMQDRSGDIRIQGMTLENQTSSHSAAEFQAAKAWEFRQANLVERQDSDADAIKGPPFIGMNIPIGPNIPLYEYSRLSSNPLFLHAETVSRHAKDNRVHSEPNQRVLVAHPDLRGDEENPTCILQEHDRHDANSRRHEWQSDMSRNIKMGEDALLHNSSHVNNRPLGSYANPVSGRLSVGTGMHTVKTSEGIYESAVIGRNSLSLNLEQHHAVISSSKDNQGPNTTPRCEIDPSQIGDELLLNRAKRAREIYLASRVFNHWADRTATRLERECVARRHMVRFRCFYSWIQVPDFRSPIIYQLKASTSIEKLRHAIAYQEEQLGVAASCSSRTYHLKRATRILQRWFNRLLIYDSHQRAMERVQLKAIRSWLFHLRTNVTIGQAIVRQKEIQNKFRTLSAWSCHNQRHRQRLQAAVQVGAIQLFCSSLEQWLEQVYVGKWASTYREKLMVKSSQRAFSSWNFLTRVQAFRWRGDYVSVARWIHKWRQFSNEHLYERTDIRIRSGGHFPKNFYRALKQTEGANAKLSSLSSRARFFIVATRVLSTLEAAAQKRKNEAKDEVRRYLMLRYTEVSASRKRRSFYETLNHWQATKSFILRNKEQTPLILAKNARVKLINTLSTWVMLMSDNIQITLTGKGYWVQLRLATWHDIAKERAEHEAESSESWILGKQQQYLKQWSISSLQRSGQAHSAVIVQQKYYGEKRNRSFQYWRHIAQPIADDLSKRDIRTTPKLMLSGSRRRALPRRRQLVKTSLHEQDLSAISMETPTRWTGAPLSMSVGFSSHLMPSVREIEERPPLSSDAGHIHTSDSASKPTNSVMLAGKMPSTTPRAPVPRHLSDNPRVVEGRKKGQTRSSTPFKSQFAEYGLRTGRLVQTMPRLPLNQSRSLLPQLGTGSDNAGSVKSPHKIFATTEIP